MQAEALDAFSALAELAELAETNPDPPNLSSAPTQAEHSSKRQCTDSSGAVHGTPQPLSDRSPNQTPSKEPDALETACQAWYEQLQQQQQVWQQRCEQLLEHGGAKVRFATYSWCMVLIMTWAATCFMILYTLPASTAELVVAT